MASAAILDNFEWSYLCHGGMEDLTALCFRKIHVTTFVTFYIVTLTITVRLNTDYAKSLQIGQLLLKLLYKMLQM